MARQQAKLHVGTSGYQYDEWRGRFYPEELPKSAWFAHYVEHFDAVELNPKPPPLSDGETPHPKAFATRLSSAATGPTSGASKMHQTRSVVS